MSSVPEAELDRLFQLPPAQLVGARDVLAAALKKAGEREGAARVKALKRPTPAAFALNQVFFAQPLLLERALAAAEQVRALHAQDGVEQRALGAAVQAQRTATQAVVEAALKLADAAGQPVGAGHQRKVLTTLQGWLTGAGDEPPGRMTHDVEPSGFDAVVSVGSPAPRALPPKSGTLAPPPPGAAPAKVAPPRVDAARLKHAAQLVAQREREASQAHGTVSKQREGVVHEKRALTRAQLAVRDAERALDDLRDAQKKQEGNLRKAEAGLAEAQAIAARADEAAARARSEQRALQGDD